MDPMRQTFEKAIAADTSQPVHIADTMAFMFESRTVIKPTRYALEGRPALQPDYAACWQGLKKHFDPWPMSESMPLDATNDPRCTSWVSSGEPRPTAISRFRICPSACSAAAAPLRRFAAASRSAIKSSTSGRSRQAA